MLLRRYAGAVRVAASGRRTDPVTGPSERHRPLIAAAAGAMALLASLLNYVSHHGYPLGTLEIGIAATMLVVFSAAVGLLYAVVGGVGRVILDILLTYLAFDLNFDGAGVVVATVVTVILFNRYLLQVMIVAFPVMIAADVIGLGLDDANVQAAANARQGAESNAPVLLHVILDEHIGVEGLSAAAPEASSLRRDLQSFYVVQNGFRLFGGAYSEYLHTVNAIPHILNLGIEQPWTSGHSEGARVGHNRYFDRLGQLGYRVRVYQSDFLDLCASPAVESCTVQRAVDLKPVAGTSLGATEKAALILYGFASLSEAAKKSARLYDLAASRLAQTGVRLPLLELHQANATGALVAFDRVIADLRHARPGEAYVVHLLLPHHPYATSRNCDFKPLYEWQLRRSPLVTRNQRELAYFDQVTCATTKVGAALRALAASPGGARSIVIVHGDHGSRITQRDPIVENVGRFDERDLINGYSTLFAVRAADIEPGYDSTHVPVAQLLSALASSSFSSATVDLPPGFVPSVVLENRDWKPIRRHELPTSWTTR